MKFLSTSTSCFLCGYFTSIKVIVIKNVMWTISPLHCCCCCCVVVIAVWLWRGLTAWLLLLRRWRAINQLGGTAATTPTATTATNNSSHCSTIHNHCSHYTTNSNHGNQQPTTAVIALTNSNQCNQQPTTAATAVCKKQVKVLLDP